MATYFSLLYNINYDKVKTIMLILKNGLYIFILLYASVHLILISLDASLSSIMISITILITGMFLLRHNTLKLNIQGQLFENISNYTYVISMYKIIIYSYHKNFIVIHSKVLQGL
jgi:hypothetical protein